jgi:hypothetical protein
MPVTRPKPSGIAPFCAEDPPSRAPIRLQFIGERVAQDLRLFEVGRAEGFGKPAGHGCKVPSLKASLLVTCRNPKPRSRTSAIHQFSFSKPPAWRICRRISSALRGAVSGTEPEDALCDGLAHRDHRREARGVREGRIRRLVINLPHPIDFIEFIFHPTRRRRPIASFYGSRVE